MTIPLDVEYLVGRIYELDDWLKALPLTQNFREQTTFRAFYELQQAKQAALGLSPDVWAQLRKVENNEELTLAIMDLGMTEEERGVRSEPYFQDLPMDFASMPEYAPVLQAVDDYFDNHGMGYVDDDALLRVVMSNMPAAKT